MTSRAQTVVVGIDESPSSTIATRWALEEARAAGAQLKLVLAYAAAMISGPEPHLASAPHLTDQGVRADADRRVEHAVAELRSVAGDVQLSGVAVQGDPVQVLLEQSKTAWRLVLGSRQLHTLGSFLLGSVGQSVASRASCPTVIVRGTWEPNAGDAIVAGVGTGSDADDVLAFAFEEASLRQVPLRAIRVWNAPVWPSRMLKDDEVERLAGQEHAALLESLAKWQAKYPEVPVTAELVHGHAASVLTELSAGPALLVVGSHSHRRAIGSMRGWVGHGVLHHAACPVAIVPVDSSG